MGETSEIRELLSPARVRILLICPQCGQENKEYVERLRGQGAYSCTGEGCDYRFELLAGAGKSLAWSFAEAWRRFYATLSPAG